MLVCSVSCKLLVGDVLERLAVLLEGGVVDQDVELAERLERLVHRLLAEAHGLHVAGDQQALAALASRRIRFVLRRVLVLGQVHDRDVRAFAREQHRHRAADAGIAAGDDRGHAVELAAAGVVRREEARFEVQLVLVAGLVEVLRGQFRRFLAKAGLRRRFFAGLLDFDCFASFASWSACAARCLRAVASPAPLPDCCLAMSHLSSWECRRRYRPTRRYRHDHPSRRAADSRARFITFMKHKERVMPRDHQGDQHAPAPRHRASRSAHGPPAARRGCAHRSSRSRALRWPAVGEQRRPCARGRQLSRRGPDPQLADRRTHRRTPARTAHRRRHHQRDRGHRRGDRRRGHAQRLGSRTLR